MGGETGTAPKTAPRPERCCGTCVHMSPDTDAQGWHSCRALDVNGNPLCLPVLEAFGVLCGYWRAAPSTAPETEPAAPETLPRQSPSEETLAAWESTARTYIDPEADMGEDPMHALDRLVLAIPILVAEVRRLRSPHHIEAASARGQEVAP